MKSLAEHEYLLGWERWFSPLGVLHAADFGTASEALPAADALAFSLLGLLGFCALCFLAGALTLRHRERQHPPTSDKEDERDKPIILPRNRPHPPSDDRPKQPWEKDADWWKK